MNDLKLHYNESMSSPNNSRPIQRSKKFKKQTIGGKMISGTRGASNRNER